MWGLYRWEKQPALDSWIQRECFPGLFLLRCFSTDNKDGTETFSNTNSSPYLTTCPIMFWRLSSFYQFVAALTGVPRKRSQLFDHLCDLHIFVLNCVHTVSLPASQTLVSTLFPSHYSDTKIFVCLKKVISHFIKNCGFFFCFVLLVNHCGGGVVVVFFIYLEYFIY